MGNWKIIILRHGESEEDKNPNIKSAVNDPAKLTQKGRQQVEVKLSELMYEYNKTSTHLIYHSPSARVKETAGIFIEALSKLYPLEVKEEAAIRNLDWGKTTTENVREIERERYRVGVLNFQFPSGDHTPTYVRNIDLFCKNMLANMLKHEDACVTLFTHGFAQRVIVKCLTEMQDADFRYLANPGNCFSYIIDIENTSGVTKVKTRTPFPRINFSID